MTLRPRGARPSPDAIVIADAPVRRWGDNSCGSAALSTLLNRLGDPISEDELNRHFSKGRHGGVVTVDLLIEARRRGYDAQLLRGDEAMLQRSVRAGLPAVVMLRVANVPGGADFFHYVVVDGFDPGKRLYRMQFGDGRARWAPLARLSDAWSAAGGAMLVVAPSGKMPLLDLHAALREGVALEEKGKLESAIARYRAVIDADPSLALAWFDLANAEAAAKHRSEAEQAYRRAIELEPDHADALNNLAWLLMEGGNAADAREFAVRAVAAAKHDRHLSVDTLARIEAKLGDCGAAQRLVDAEMAAGGASELAALQITRRELSVLCRARFTD